MNALSRWSTEQANAWYALQPRLLGCNFTPSNAINQLEMWQADTFDPATIERELAWASHLGFNTIRTFLHDLAWETDPGGFKDRLDCFLDIASRHGIRPILVFFDDCWNPDPQIGLQPAPQPGIHNSGWVQSPGIRMVNSGPAAWGRLEQYVSDVIGAFAAEDRILFWDLYNEPGNSGNGSKSLPLLQAVFEWARAAKPSQPLSAGVWFENQQLNEFQLAASDIITFHNYGPGPDLELAIAELKAYGRPIICTEWMARTCGSLVGTHLPVFAREQVGCINWGLVSGKTNTIYQWQVVPGAEDNPVTIFLKKNIDSKVWFHDLLHPDGSPYDPAEIELFRKFRSEQSFDPPAAA